MPGARLTRPSLPTRPRQAERFRVGIIVPPPIPGGLRGAVPKRPPQSHLACQETHDIPLGKDIAASQPYADLAGRERIGGFFEHLSRGHGHLGVGTQLCDHDEL